MSEVLTRPYCPICGTHLMDQHIDALARTIIGEARGEGLLDMLGVACVVRERVLRPGWWGRDVEGVCKAPWQFTCWHDHNRAATDQAETLPQWSTALAVARMALYEMTDRDVGQLFGVYSWGDIPQRLLGDGFPTHYHDRSIDTPKAWGDDLTEINVPWESVFRWYVVRQGRPRRR